jgi:hypothetical protein
VFHPLKDFQALLQDSMGRTAFDIRYKPYSAGIMLILFAIKTSGSALVYPFFILAHDDSFDIVNLSAETFPKLQFLRMLLGFDVSQTI